MFSINPCSPDFVNTLEFFLKIIGGIGGVILFVIGFSRYKKDQIWRRSEFVAKEIKDFTSDKMVLNTMFMLDWGERKIELFPDKPNYDDRFAKVNRTILQSALIFHKLRTRNPGEDRFTPVEVAIRDNFDHFLSYFERFEQFIVARLITAEEIQPYIDYWIITIADELEENTKEVLYNFINEYKFRGTQNLFNRYNKKILPKVKSSDLVKQLEKAD